jgi:hypothetical protein
MLSVTIDHHNDICTLSYPMEKLLCESIVYCDFFIDFTAHCGVLIDKKHLFVCLFVHILLSNVF